MPEVCVAPKLLSSFNSNLAIRAVTPSLSTAACSLCICSQENSTAWPWTIWHRLAGSEWCLRVRTCRRELCSYASLSFGTRSLAALFPVAHCIRAQGCEEEYDHTKPVDDDFQEDHFALSAHRFHSAMNIFNCFCAGRIHRTTDLLRRHVSSVNFS